MNQNAESTSRRETVFAGLGAGALVAAVVAGGVAAARTPRAAAPGAGPQAALGSKASPGARRFPDVKLVTHEGREVRLYSDLIRDRIVTFNMTYVQCNNLCPPMTRNLMEVQRSLGGRVGRDVHMYSISVLPEVDTPADLREYVALNRIEPGWTFLTGSADAVRQARIALGFYDRDPQIDADRTQHTGLLRIGNDALDRWCMTPALLEPELIVESLYAVDPRGRAVRDAASRHSTQHRIHVGNRGEDRTTARAQTT